MPGPGKRGQLVSRTVARMLAAGVAGVLVTFGVAVAAGAAPSAGSNVRAPRDSAWVGAWAASPQKPEQAGFSDVTLRMIVHTTIGGSPVRIRLTNEFGTQPLQIGAATIGVVSHGAQVQSATLRPLAFGGAQSTTIAPGGATASDGVDLQVPAETDLAVSLYLPIATGDPTEHADFGAAHQVSYISGTGNHAADPAASAYPTTTTSWFFLDGVDVVHAGAGAVVTLGDSITDGTHSSDNTNHRYPDWLADRLQRSGGPYAKLSVLNAGIGGNELLQTSACCGSSPSGLDRLDTDVLAQPGLRDVVVMLGTNDILGAHHASADAVVAGLQELADRVHAAHVRIYGGTITPSTQYSATGQQTVAAVNQWIRTSGAFDGVVDFAGATADPSQPTRLNPIYDSGDHLHPNDTGYHAMANAVDLTALIDNNQPPGPACLVRPSLQQIKPGAGVDVTCHPQPAGYTYDDAASAVVYGSGWTHADSSASYTYGDYDSTESYAWQAGDSLTVTFTGTGVEWVGPLGSNAGIANVSIDGGTAVSVDTYAPWGKQFQQDVFSRTGLPSGTHTLTITATNTKNPSSSGTGIVVDAIEVTG